MISLIAKKRLTYAGRAMRPGVGFSARAVHARALVATGFAVLAPGPQPVEMTGLPHVYQVAALGVVPVDDLRARYEAAAGKKPDMRWGVKRLEQEIAAL